MYTMFEGTCPSMQALLHGMHWCLMYYIIYTIQSVNGTLDETSDSDIIVSRFKSNYNFIPYMSSLLLPYF